MTKAIENFPALSAWMASTRPALTDLTAEIAPETSVLVSSALADIEDAEDKESLIAAMSEYNKITRKAKALSRVRLTAAEWAEVRPPQDASGIESAMRATLRRLALVSARKTLRKSAGDIGGAAIDAIEADTLRATLRKLSATQKAALLAD